MKMRSFGCVELCTRVNKLHAILVRELIVYVILIPKYDNFVVVVCVFVIQTQKI